MTAAIRTCELGKRFGQQWALRDCTLDVPAGSIAAVVGPNGAGKTTLIHLTVGLTKPTTGTVEVFGKVPGRLESVACTGYVGQDHLLYRKFRVSEMLTLGRKLNQRWDDDFARQRLGQVGIPLEKSMDALSRGQQAQVALVLALAKRPELIVLDEPLASLDPLARHEFLQTLMDAVAETGMSVLLSSHVLADLERVCDFLVVVVDGRLQLAGSVDLIVSSHRRLTGLRGDAVIRRHEVIQVRETERQTSLLVRTNGQLFDAAWHSSNVDLEEIVLAYLGRPASSTVVPVANDPTAPQLKVVS